MACQEVADQWSVVFEQYTDPVMISSIWVD